MKRLSVDSATPAVKKFVRSIAKNANGVEVILGGNVICRVIPPGQLSDAERAVQLAGLRTLLGKARANSKRLPATVIEGRIRHAIAAIRQGR
jgi:hypothetical protein